MEGTVWRLLPPVGGMVVLGFAGGVIALSATAPDATGQTVQGLPALTAGADGAASPAAASPSASGQPIGVIPNRGWYVLVKVEQPRTGYRDHNTYVGQLRDASDGYDPNDLVEMPPFASPYMTMAIPHPDWGPKAGDYGRDFRSAEGDTRWKLRPATWPLEIRADPGDIDVVVTWEGDSRILRRSRLRDADAGAVIEASGDRASVGYVLAVRGGKRRLQWEFLGIERKVEGGQTSAAPSP